jgi:hypothetical protein
MGKGKASGPAQVDDSSTTTSTEAANDILINTIFEYARTHDDDVAVQLSHAR